ncbi:MAG TPA: flagellar basal-body MS-ring/collar protein FliF [Spirochaetia bacterium]|nr:flagellar basal-body MS-ring/collar protein FliF [Spirochaetia bacterium]
MNEWFKKVLDQIKSLWSKWTKLQKVILVSIVGAVILGIVLLVTFSRSPSMVSLLSTPITDTELLDKISLRLDEEKVDHTVTADGRILVADKKTAQRMVAVLMREDLLPKDISPWDVFKMDSWSVTDFERDVNLRQAITKNLEQHIMALEDVDAAKVTLVIPEEKLFAEDQNPPSASIIITPKPGSDILTNRKKIEGIQKLVKFAVEGLKDENIVITDYRGMVLNDFAGMEEFDRLELSKRQIKQKEDLERRYKEQIYSELKTIFGEDRVSVLKVDINLDFRKESVQTEEHFPITTVPDNPKTPYSEYDYVLSIPRSTESKEETFEGTGFNPEGPPGQEGQTPPAYKDLSNLVGKYSNKSNIVNQEVNTRNIQEEKSPWEIKRVTIGVAIDGIWKWKYNDKGQVEFDTDGSIKRIYEPVSDVDLQKAKTLIEHAIGYDQTRGDSVTVQHLQFDRTGQFSREDEQFRNQKRLQQGILYGLIGLGVIVVAFVVFRLVSKELERKRRLREEELARQHQAMREAALRSAEEEGVEVQMSVEERARMEMQENAINMAREHPEDVAQLIRTWLVEE